MSLRKHVYFSLPETDHAKRKEKSDRQQPASVSQNLKSKVNELQQNTSKYDNLIASYILTSNTPQISSIKQNYESLKIKQSNGSSRVNIHSIPPLTDKESKS